MILIPHPLLTSAGRLSLRERSYMNYSLSSEEGGERMRFFIVTVFARGATDRGNLPL
ncbi:hypothetical protein [Salinimicrobium flavum]|uniref:Uncharacterized protein n=1 Tax=Salinimicrobium flavum TaxID=1737065 RepID=A0ABW5IWV7_9FLAO